MIKNQELIQTIKSILPQVINLRHAIHKDPELGFKEFKTREKILNFLKETSINFSAPLLETDIVGNLKGKKSKTICLRADIDALPIQETTNKYYESKNSGVAHSCGHDGHTAILAGTALVLNSLKDYLPNSIRFVFQPAEEMYCGGGDLVKKGAIDGCSEAYALHCSPTFAENQIVSKIGVMYAACGLFEIKISGVGTHGARPDLGNNPIPPLANIILELKNLHNKQNKIDGSIVSVCTVNTVGGSSNIIPDDIIISGTFRYFKTKIGDSIEKNIRSIVNNICEEHNLKNNIDIERKYYIPLNNSELGFNKIKNAAEGIIPKKDFLLAKPSTGTEDFSFYLDKCEGAMFWLGQGKSNTYVHNSSFDFNDTVIETGIHLMCKIALSN